MYPTELVEEETEQAPCITIVSRRCRRVQNVSRDGAGRLCRFLRQSISARKVGSIGPPTYLPLRASLIAATVSSLGVL